MKLHLATLTLLLSVSTGVCAGIDLIGQPDIRQDIENMRALGDSYRDVAKSASDAQARQTSAQRQGNLPQMALATERLAYYRWSLEQVRSALAQAKAKLGADLHETSAASEAAGG